MAIKITSFFASNQEHIINESLSLKDDGIYWYLYPYFQKLFEQTGEMVDLYGIARFTRDALLELDNTLTNARKAAVAQPNEWEQEVGKLIKPKKEILYDKVLKRNVIAMIDSLKNITSEGIKNNAVIVFEGL